ncbi:hypothetical protein [Paenibacillus sp. XY044]|uniref:hypothetical protein n=1 Tax=Paenibacillus sp. XY044 TaxID=2026089 RepID=UPI000B982C79|nr:hypothetical protein [Paenibacillus sp. XY044]OZB98135.1 hypothetical protein CJP46_02905 [Paenibacillus sp. XY044]
MSYANKQLENVKTIKEEADYVFEEINSNIFTVIKDRGWFAGYEYASADEVLKFLNSDRKIIILNRGCTTILHKNF